MRVSTLSGVLVVALSCGKPYQPFCRVTQVQQVSERTGSLQLGPGGRVSLLSIDTRIERDGGVERTAHVEVYEAGGDRLDAWQVELPVPRGLFGLFGGSPAVDLESSVALVTPEELQTVGPDGGTFIVRSTRLELRYRDGGITDVPADFEPYAVFRAENSAVFASGLFGSPAVMLAVPELNPSATVKRTLPAGDHVAQGGDALAVLPGPRLLTSSLEPLATAAQSAPVTGFFGPPVFTWSRAAAVIASAWVDREGNLLEQSFGFDGAPLATPARVSSGTGVLALAHSEHGTAVVFNAAGSFDGGAPRQWFAFADAQGVKKGPDLPLPAGAIGFAAPVVAASPSGDRFGIFAVIDGVQHIAVQCE